MKRFVILDRDGTINVDSQYISDPEAVKLLPGAVKGLQELQKMGLGLVVITNQSGIGRGFLREEEASRVNRRIQDLLKNQGVTLDGIYVCPHQPEDSCSCRKPATGLLEQAARELKFLPEECFVIGDKESDVELGFRVGATSFFISSNASQEGILRSQKNSSCHVVRNLPEAAQIIRTLL